MISLITVNYNNVKVTCELIESLQSFDKSAFELIVVDNASKENASIIIKKFPWVKFVRSEKNLGFAGGNNLGVTHAHGDYLFFINNDTEFKENILFKLRNILAQDKSIGVVCPVLKYYDAPSKIQFAGFTKINRFTGRNELITTVSQKKIITTSYAHGAAMMMPRYVFNQVGPMPENYFVYYEELDWSAQIANKGYQLVVDSSCVLFHKESQTIGKLNEMKSYFMARNRLLFMRRNSTRISLSLFWIYFLLVSTPKKLVSYFLAKQWKNAMAHLAGIHWNIIHSRNSQKLGYKFNTLTSL
jgi:GT2 family glycosyltransferase